MIVPRLEQYRHVLVNYMFPWRNRVLLLALMLFTSIGLQLVNPQILRLFIDTAIGSSSPALPGLYWPAPDTTQTQLLMVALLFMVIAVLQQLVAVGAVFYGEDVGWKATNKLRSDLAAHCLRLDMSFHHQRTPGEMIERVDSDVTQIANFFSQFVIIVIAHVLLLAGVVTMIFRENALVGVVMAFYALFTLWALNRRAQLRHPRLGLRARGQRQFLRLPRGATLRHRGHALQRRRPLDAAQLRAPDEFSPEERAESRHDECGHLRCGCFLRRPGAPASRWWQAICSTARESSRWARCSSS